MDRELKEYQAELMNAVKAFMDVRPDQPDLAEYMESAVTSAAWQLKKKLERDR